MPTIARRYKMEAPMISNNCSIDEFVESVKAKSPWEVIALAVEEATLADRMIYRSDGQRESIRYSQRLKRLIGLLRYETKPKRHDDKIHRLYTTHWATGPNPPA